jgi:hypothetical protein
MAIFKQSKPVTRTVDDFFIHASSKLGKEELSNMPILREAFDSTGLKDLFMGFQGRRGVYSGLAESSIPFDMGKAIAGEDLGRTTIAAVLDEKTYKKLYGESGDNAMSETLGYFKTETAEARNILRGAGIEYGEHVTGIVAVNPNLLKSQEGNFYNPNKALLTTTHEYGHGASTISGADEVDEVFEKFKVVGRELDEDYRMVKEYRAGKVPQEHMSPNRLAMANNSDELQSRFDYFTESFYDYMKAHGLEEGRAESFSIELQQRSEQARGIGAKTVEDVRRLSLEDERLAVGYFKPRGFDNYASYPEYYLKGMINEIDPEDVAKLRGPMTEKVGLTAEELLDEVLAKGKHTGTAAFYGSMRGVSGIHGEAIAREIDEVHEPALIARNTDNIGPIQADRMAAYRARHI